MGLVHHLEGKTRYQEQQVAGEVTEDEAKGEQQLSTRAENGDLHFSLPASSALPDYSVQSLGRYGASPDPLKRIEVPSTFSLPQTAPQCLKATRRVNGSPELSKGTRKPSTPPRLVRNCLPPSSTSQDGREKGKFEGE